MTMPGDYSEELVELVARVAYHEFWEGSPPEEWDSVPVGELASFFGEARAILDALSSAGRLTPEGSEKEWRVRFPTTRNVLGISPWLNEQESRNAAAQANQAGLPAVVESRLITPWTPSEPEEKP